MDRSVLLDNTPLVKFIRNDIRDSSGVFSISSLVKILMTSFPAFSRLFVQTVCENGEGKICLFVYITSNSRRLESAFDVTRL